MDLIIAILPVVTKDLPISPRFTPYNLLSRCKSSTLTTRRTHGIPPAFRDGVHLYRQPPLVQSRVYRVTQLRTDNVHCRESAGIGPIVLKVIPVTGAAFSGLVGITMGQILRRERGQGNMYFPCSADHVQDWQPYPVDPYSC